MGDMVEELLVIKQLVLSRETRPSYHSLRLVRILMETMMGDGGFPCDQAACPLSTPCTVLKTWTS